MKKNLIVALAISIFFNVSAMQISDKHSDMNTGIVLCAICKKPIDSDGKCWRYLRSLFEKINIFRGSKPDMAVVHHPACFKKAVEAFAPCERRGDQPTDLTLSQLAKDFARSAGGLCISLAVIPAMVLIPAGIGCAGFSIVTFPAYYAGEKLVGNYFDIPFVIALMFGTNHCFNHNEHFGLGQGLATLMCFSLGVGAYFIDAWVYSKLFC